MLTPVLLFGPIPGGPELIIILAVVVLLFGANKIPELARASGQAMGEFRRGREEIEQEIKEAATTETQTDDVDTTDDSEATTTVDDNSEERSAEKAV